MVGAIHRIAQAIGVNRPYLLAFLVALTSCATTAPHEFAEARADWQTRSGQLLYRNPKATVIGDVFVRFSPNGDFELTFSKGPGVNLLFLRQDSTSAEIKGPLAGRDWSGPIDGAPQQLRGWLDAGMEQVKPAPGHGVLPRISVPSTSASTPNTNCPVCQFQPAVPPPSPPEMLKLPVVETGLNVLWLERPQAPPPLMPR